MYESVLWQRVFECRETCTFCRGIPLENTTDITHISWTPEKTPENSVQLLYTALENPETVRGDDQVSCIIATQHLTLTPANWGENPVIQVRNVTVTGRPMEEDEENACKVHPSGEIQLLVGDQPDFVFWVLINGDGIGGVYITFENIRVTAEIGATFGDMEGSSVGQSYFDVGFLVLGLGLDWVGNTNERRGLIAHNMHTVSDCAGGRFT
eukprot:8081272-Pyramimonas_sp.AAC.1